MSSFIANPILASSISQTRHLPSLEKAFQLLDDAEIVIGDRKPDVSGALLEIRHIFGKDHFKPSFKYARQNAELHDRVSHVAKEAHSILELREIWTQFLNSVDHLAMRYPDGIQLVRLDFSPERHLLESSKISNIFITPLDLSADISQEDRDAIWLIQNESFGSYELPPREAFEAWYRSDTHTLLVAREEATGSIVGFLLFSKNSDHLAIHILARRPNAAKCGIGFQLMRMFFDEYAREEVEVSLCVRESHLHAQNLYRRFGFEDNGYTMPERASPIERDLMMIRKRKS